VIREMVSAWLKKLGIVAKDIVNTVVSTLNSSKLSKEIVDLYNNLKSAGLPENLVIEIARDFYKKKLETAPSLNDLVKSLS
jgi:aminopeptidase C